MVIILVNKTVVHWKFATRVDLTCSHHKKILKFWGFPGGAVVKNLPANAGDTGLSPGPGRSHMPWSN